MKQLPDDSHFNPESPLYQPLRFNHEGCSDGKDACLIITRLPTGWQVYCHRCKLVLFKPVKGLSPKDTIKFINATAEHKNVVDGEAVVLPQDYTTTIPPHGLVFLYRYMTSDDIIRHRVVYSSSYDRVIFPIYEGNTLVCWQGRTLGVVSKENPKWLIQRIYGKKYNCYKIDDHISATVVLVENILSAIRISTTHNCYALLGSYIHDDLIRQLLKEYTKIILWLDADKLQYALKVHRRIAHRGCDCRTLYTEVKPKDMSLKQIAKTLGED